jgi:hypothetical protein
MKGYWRSVNSDHRSRCHGNNVHKADGKIYQLTNHDADLRTHAGHTVNLAGELKGDSIRVSTLQPTSAGRASEINR